MVETFAIPVVSILVERASPTGEKQILMQVRQKAGKQQTKVYPGVWELPQGKIRAGETILEAAFRELHEETGLRALGLVGQYRDTTQCILYSETEALKPLICAVDTTYSYIGIAVVVEATGAIQKTGEATDHQWLGGAEINRLIRDNRVFPLNVPMIQEYFRREAREL